MTQPAKVQEPSMEEILASIRRIIADDEAKPAGGEQVAVAPRPEPPKAVPPGAKAHVMTSIPPTTLSAVKPATAPPPKPAAVAPKPPSPPPSSASNSQDDIDSMLAGLDAATTEQEVRPPRPDGDVFELTDEMALPDPPKPSFRKVEPQFDVEFADSAATAEQPRYTEPAPEVAAPPIMSRATVNAVESAFNSLATTVLSNNARTLEDLVKEMLRPMLKSWLDDNLPGLVERIVKSEIERVSRGR